MVGFILGYFCVNKYSPFASNLDRIFRNNKSNKNYKKKIFNEE